MIKIRLNWLSWGVYLHSNSDVTGTVQAYYSAPPITCWDDAALCQCTTQAQGTSSAAWLQWLRATHCLHSRPKCCSPDSRKRPETALIRVQNRISDIQQCPKYNIAKMVYNAACTILHFCITIDLIKFHKKRSYHFAWAHYHWWVNVQNNSSYDIDR